MNSDERLEKMAELFEKFGNSEYIKFARVENKLHERPDLCAFILLDKLVPGAGRDMIAGAEHDEIYLDVDPRKLAEVATEADVLTLVRCGVRYEIGGDGLAMFAPKAITDVKQVIENEAFQVYSGRGYYFDVVKSTSDGWVVFTPWARWLHDGTGWVEGLRKAPMGTGSKEFNYPSHTKGLDGAVTREQAIQFARELINRK